MNSSIEKAERARAALQIAIWNDSVSWRGPLREYARVCAAIRGGIRVELKETDQRPGIHTTEASERRLQFLGWEIEKLIETHRARFRSASELLNSIFFDELDFQVAIQTSIQTGAQTVTHGGWPVDAGLTPRRLDASTALFDPVLARRCGPPTLISVLYAWTSEFVARAFGDECDFQRVDLVSGTPTEVVRVIPKDDRGEVWLLDLAKRGGRVSELDWAAWCAAATGGFSRLTWVQGLVKSLTELFRLIEKMPNLSLDLLSAQLYVLDQIISLQPSETSRWAERAMLNTRRGDSSSALDDLKRFFAFHERDSAPSAIVNLFDDLRGRDLNS